MLRWLTCRQRARLLRLLGVLTHGVLDNGHGRARLNLFRHKHEVESGRTSSVSQEMLGFDPSGAPLFCGRGDMTWSDVCARSAKIVTLIDLAGHGRFLRTTVCGLTARVPNYAMLVVSAATGVCGTAREHLALLSALQVSFFVVVAKTDTCLPSQQRSVMDGIKAALTPALCDRVLEVVGVDADVAALAVRFTSHHAIPVFSVSSVTGVGLDALRSFLFHLRGDAPRIDTMSRAPQRTSTIPAMAVAADAAVGADAAQLLRPTSCGRCDFQIEETCFVSDVGVVVSGTLLSGAIREGDTLYAGPNADGHFEPVRVLSIHRNRMLTPGIQEGHRASLAIAGLPRGCVRVGMSLVCRPEQAVACSEFDAVMKVLATPAVLAPGIRATVHIGSVCQTVEIVATATMGAESADLPLGTGSCDARPPPPPPLMLSVDADAAARPSRDYRSRGTSDPSAGAGGARAAVSPRQRRVSESAVLHMNEQVGLRLRFVRRPECVRLGSQVLLRDTRTRCVGVVTHVERL